MGDLIAVLLTVATSMAHVAPSETVPDIRLIPGEELQVMACGNPEKCHELHFFTAPDTGVIYINKSVDMSLTFAKAELLHEVARFVLSQNKIYSAKNTCARNVKIEDALIRMEFDYIHEQVRQNAYIGAGVPRLKDLPQHVFFCVPENSTGVRHEQQ